MTTCIYNIYPTKKETHHIELFCSTPRKITRDNTVSFISVQWYVRYCCIAHLLQSGVRNVLMTIGYEPIKWGSNCKVTENKRFYNALLLDKFKQWESSR